MYGLVGDVGEQFVVTNSEMMQGRSLSRRAYADKGVRIYLEGCWRQRKRMWIRQVSGDDRAGRDTVTEKD